MDGGFAEGPLLVGCAVVGGGGGGGGVGGGGGGPGGGGVGGGVGGGGWGGGRRGGGGGSRTSSEHSLLEITLVVLVAHEDWRTHHKGLPRKVWVAAPGGVHMRR